MSVGVGAGWPIAIILAVCAVGGTSAAREPARNGGFSPVVQTIQGAAATQSVPADYRIGARDTLDVEVFQVPDLSKSVQVDGSGIILLPLIGQINAAGRTTSQLSNDISVALAKTYV